MNNTPLKRGFKRLSGLYAVSWIGEFTVSFFDVVNKLIIAWGWTELIKLTRPENNWFAKALVLYKIKIYLLLDQSMSPIAILELSYAAGK